MTDAPPSVALGLRAQKGGAVVVGLGLDKGEPLLLLSTFLAIGEEPYRAAAALPQDQAKAVVAEGRRRQDLLAAKGLRTILESLRPPLVAALLVNRAAWITDLLSYSREWAEHIPVAENLALRDALRFACRENGVELAEWGEKSLPDQAAESLGDVEARLAVFGAAAGTPWRKEQKLASLAAWMSLREINAS